MATDATNTGAPVNPAPAGLGAAAKFNPQLWKPDELRAIFVARQAELGELVRRVRQAKAGAAAQHVLITGHRGMGKSTLLHRLALAIDDDADLRQAWVPLLFREEQYTAVTLDKFWRNALDALSEALERRAGPQSGLQAEIRNIDAINAKLDQEPSTSKREQLALAALHDWAQRHQARFMLLVDSTEQLFEGLGHGKTKGDQPLWRLRECLSHDATFLWISCAYTALEAHQPYDHPFHEFFAQLPLKPLTSADMRLAFMALARTFGAGRGLPADQAEAHAQALLNQQPERLETLLRLAGGNPRTTVLLYQLLAAGGYDSVHSDLQRLLDDVSPLYKDRLENQLAVQPRQIVATLMEHWAPMSAKAVAQTTTLPVTQVNAQLSRLESGGWIEKVRLPGTRRSGYQMSERLFNVWYLMRLAPRRLRLRLTWLVEFMRVWFSDAERTQLAARRALDHRQGQWSDDRHLEFSRALSLSLPDSAPERAQLDLAIYSRTVRGRIGEVVIFETNGDDQPFASIDDYQARFAQLRPALEKVRFGADQNFDKTAFITGVLKSLSLNLKGKEHVAAVAATLSRAQCDGLLEMFNEETDHWSKNFLDADDLDALWARVGAADFFPDAPDLALAIIQASACFHDRPAAHALVLTLIFARHRYAAKQIAAALPAVGQGLPLRAPLMNEIARLLAASGKYRAAEAAYRLAIAIDPAAPHPLANLAWMMAKSARHTDAAELYRRFLDTPAAAAQYSRFQYTNVALLAHLFLGEQVAAAQALTQLTTQLDNTPQRSDAMSVIEVLANELHAMARGLPFADLLAQDAKTELLKPIELALRLANGQPERLWDQPAELQALAKEIAQRWAAPG